MSNFFLFLQVTTEFLLLWSHLPTKNNKDIKTGRKTTQKCLQVNSTNKAGKYNKNRKTTVTERQHAIDLESFPD